MSKCYWIERAADLCGEYDLAEVRLAAELEVAATNGTIGFEEIARVLCLVAEERWTELVREETVFDA